MSRSVPSKVWLDTTDLDEVNTTVHLDLYQQTGRIRSQGKPPYLAMVMAL